MVLSAKALIQGWEWIVVIGIIVIVLFLAPKKLPEYARAVGEARKELRKSRSEEEKVPKKEGDEDLVFRIARELGIDTEGKTAEEVEQEIVHSRKRTKQPNR